MSATVEPTAAPRFARFVEPTEGAFSLTHPEGWRASGGLVRGGPMPRPWYRLLSPGGSAELRGSDPRVPSFVDPSTGMMFGMPLPPMPNVAPRPYTPAWAFAAEYARHLARELGATGFQQTGARDAETMLRDDPRPDSRPRVMMMLQQGAEFAGLTFDLPDLDRRGLVDVLTLRIPGPMGLWWVPFITTLVGPAREWEHAKAMMLSICHSYATTPAWQQMETMRQNASHQMVMDNIATGNRILNMQAQSGMEAIAAHAQRAQISAQAHQDVSAMHMDSWRAQQASGDEVHRRSVNAVRETVDLYDPASGAVYRGAPAGFTTWWTDGADRVVGSTSHDNPDPTHLTQAVDLDDVPRDGRPPRR